MEPLSFLKNALDMLLATVETLLSFDDPLSYKGKKFEIESSRALVYNDDFSEKVYKVGDTLPSGKSIGDKVVIPKGTVVEITHTASKPASSENGNDALYVFVKGIGLTNPNFLKGRFWNETLGIIMPATYISEDPLHKTVGNMNAVLRNRQAPIYVERKPRQRIERGETVTIERTSADGKHVLVTDSNGTRLGWTALSNLGANPPDPNKPLQRKVEDRDARLRDEVVIYSETSNKIDQGKLVIVKEISQDTNPVGVYVRVAKVEQQGANYVEAGEWGWTAASNLVDGWADAKGGNAAWDKGNYIGLVEVIGIQGYKGPEQITTRNLAAYLALQKAAAAAGHELAIGDGFRDYPKQQSLYSACAPKCNGLVGVPGYSNHQDGQALDLNLGKHDFTSSLYTWLKNNAPQYGWIRTVNCEAHHWEFNLELVAQNHYAYKTSDVKDVNCEKEE